MKKIGVWKSERRRARRNVEQSKGSKEQARRLEESDELIIKTYSFFSIWEPKAYYITMGIFCKASSLIVSWPPAFLHLAYFFQLPELQMYSPKLHSLQLLGLQLPELQMYIPKLHSLQLSGLQLPELQSRPPVYSLTLPGLQFLVSISLSFSFLASNFLGPSVLASSFLPLLFPAFYLPGLKLPILQLPGLKLPSP